MIDREKEYWFAFEPYIHITHKQEIALIYNTLDGNHLVVTNKEILTLLCDIAKTENCGVIKITSEHWKNEHIANFLEQSRDLFFSDLYECGLSKGKPIQFYPILNLQEEVNRLQKLNSDHTGAKMFSYLYEITIETKGLSESQLGMYMESVWQQIRYSSLKQFRIIPDNKEQIVFIRSWLMNKEYPSEQIVWQLNPELVVENMDTWQECICICIDNISFNLPKMEFPNVKWLFKIHTEEELSIVSEWIEKHSVNNYQIVSVYNGKNLDFFEKFVYLNEEDLFNQPVSMQNIMRNQVLNTHDFGKFHITPDGNIYSNRLLSPIGNLYTDSIRQLVQKEMTEGKSWLRIRNQEPCSQCIYQWLCPSPSNYELIIGKSNLCHIAPKDDNHVQSPTSSTDSR